MAPRWGGRAAKRAVGGVALLVVAGSAVWAARTPVGAGLLRSTSHFAPVAGDARVLFEPGAEEMAARVAAALDSAIAVVEAGHGAPFEEPFTVYVCATQQSLNAYIGLPPRAPIRGTVRFGDVFLAPSAFDWEGEDVHRESLVHEMSHLHLRQRLGFAAHRGRVPAWFHEGLADLVSGAGGEGVSREEARGAILDGPALRPDSTGALWSLRRAGSYGLPGPMLHRQSIMFLEHLRGLDPSAFEAFVVAVQRERSFAGPFRAHFGSGVQEAWSAFADSLRAERLDGVDAQGAQGGGGQREADRGQEGEGAQGQREGVGGLDAPE